MNFKTSGIVSRKKNIHKLKLNEIDEKKIINEKNPAVPNILKTHKIFKTSGVIFLWDRV